MIKIAILCIAGMAIIPKPAPLPEKLKIYCEKKPKECWS
jgi:hypothetical protein